MNVQSSKWINKTTYDCPEQQMNVHNNKWMSRVVNECLEQLMNVYNSKRMSITVNERPEQQKNVHSSMWMPRAANECPELHMSIQSSKWMSKAANELTNHQMNVQGVHLLFYTWLFHEPNEPVCIWQSRKYDHGGTIWLLLFIYFLGVLHVNEISLCEIDKLKIWASAGWCDLFLLCSFTHSRSPMFLLESWVWFHLF